MVGASIASELFPLGDPRGQRVQVGGDWFDVVGVAEGRDAPGAAAPSAPGT